MADKPTEAEATQAEPAHVEPTRAETPISDRSPAGDADSGLLPGRQAAQPDAPSESKGSGASPTDARSADSAPVADTPSAATASDGLRELHELDRQGAPTDLGEVFTRAGELPLLPVHRQQTVSNPVAQAGAIAGALAVLVLLLGVYQLAVLIAVAGAGAGYLGLRLAESTAAREGYAMAVTALMIGAMVLALSSLAWMVDSSGSSTDKHGLTGSSDSSLYRITDKRCSEASDGKLRFSADLENRSDQTHGFRLVVAFMHGSDQVATASPQVSGLAPGDTSSLQAIGPDAALASACEVQSVVIIS